MLVKLSKDHHNTSQANLYAFPTYLMFYYYIESEAIFKAKSIIFLFSFAFYEALLILILLFDKLVFSCDAASRLLLSLKHGILLGFFLVFIISLKNVGIKVHLYNKRRNYV